MEALYAASVSLVNKTSLLTLILAALLVFIIKRNWSFSRPAVAADERRDNKDSKPPAAYKRTIPFVTIHQLNWRDLDRALDQYHEEASNILNGLSRSLEVARQSEWDVFGGACLTKDGLLAEKLQERLDRLAPLLDHDEKMLQERLFRPFPVRKVLAANEDQHRDLSGNSMPARPPRNLPPNRFTKLDAESSSYDSAPQVVAHMTRDWSQMGRSVRSKTYDWCRQQLLESFGATSSRTKVLVPGAGLGRLAYDLAFCGGYTVEANDSSLVMAAAAYAVLQRGAFGSLHPCLMDFFVNEIDAETRYQSVSFPDVDLSHAPKVDGGTLSFTIGDFVEAYASPTSRNRFDSIVTCFFLDTATNIYEYLAVISNVLRIGGIWVNVGPLQWHRNALLHPSADELNRVIKTMGFEITHWSIDQTPFDYRMEEEEGSAVQSTKFEAYRPLRMVAIRRRTNEALLSRLLGRKKVPKKEVLVGESQEHDWTDKLCDWRWICIDRSTVDWR